MSPKYIADNNFVARGHASPAIPRGDALSSVLSMQQGSDLVVGVQPDDSNDTRLVAHLDPRALQSEVHKLLETNKQNKAKARKASLVPLVEAIGLVLHVRGSHYGHHLDMHGVSSGSNYSNTLVQLAAYFDESMGCLANSRIAELVDSEIDELAERFSHPEFLPAPASDWPAFTSLANYLKDRHGHMATVRAVGVEEAAPRLFVEKPRQKFKVLLKWSGGSTMGKETAVTVGLEDTIFDLKIQLCRLEPSLAIEAVRLSVLGTPLGFNSFVEKYNPEVDKSVTVGEYGLTPGIQVTLSTTTAAGSLLY